MPYIKRDAAGQIEAVSQTALDGFEEIDDNHAELIDFASALSDNRLANTDLGFVRVVEDLIELLIKKNFILFTELPEPAQVKIAGAAKVA